MNNLNVLSSLLSLLRVNHTSNFTNKFYNEHPYKNNLFGISKMLNSYGVDNVGIRLNNKEDILKLETPFLVHVSFDFGVVHRLDPQKISYIWNGQDISVDINEFYKIWDGVILCVEADKNSAEPNYSYNRRKTFFNVLSKNILLILIGIMGITGFIGNTIYSNLGLFISLIINVIGIYISYLLVLKQMHYSSKSADMICSLFKKSDCNDVLDTAAAKFMDIIGWSEIGLGYFISNCILILFFPKLYPYLFLINIFALPYTIWSVWYQKFKAKQWCMLCLIVQVLLWAVFICNMIFGMTHMPDFAASNIISDLIRIAAIFLIPTLFVNQLVPLIVIKNREQATIYEANSFKMDDDVFMGLLDKETRYEVDKSTSQLLFGNPDAEVLVTVYSNPHCNPCSKMHKRIEAILDRMGDEICVQYILTSFKEELNKSSYFLIAAYLHSDYSQAVGIFNEWYVGNGAQREKLVERYNFDLESKAVQGEWQKHRDFREKAKLPSTPYILVNGRFLGEKYNIEDIEFFLDNLKTL